MKTERQSWQRRSIAADSLSSEMRRPKTVGQVAELVTACSMSAAVKCRSIVFLVARTVLPVCVVLTDGVDDKAGLQGGASSAAKTKAASFGAKRDRNSSLAQNS
jgi:hypothetical protein